MRCKRDARDRRVFVVVVGCGRGRRRGRAGLDRAGRPGRRRVPALRPASSRSTSPRQLEKKPAKLRSPVSAVTVTGRVLAARNIVSIENPEVPLTDTPARLARHRARHPHREAVNEITALGHVRGVAGGAGHLQRAGVAAVPRLPQVGDAACARRRSGRELLDDPHPDMTPFELWQTVYVHRGCGATPTSASCATSSARSQSCGRSTRPGEGRPRVETGRKVYSIDGGKEVHVGDDQILHLPGLGVRRHLRRLPDPRRARVDRPRPGRPGVRRQAVRQRLAGHRHPADRAAADPEAGRRALRSGGRTSAPARQRPRHDRARQGRQVPAADDPAGDAQFLESRRFQITEVCRWFGIPPFLMFETEKSTSWGTGLEQQALGWVKFDLLPELTAVEQRVTKHVCAPAGLRPYSPRGAAARRLDRPRGVLQGACGTSARSVDQRDPRLRGARPGRGRRRPLPAAQHGRARHHRHRRRRQPTAADPPETGSKEPANA
jgi:hypothetical protein